MMLWIFTVCNCGMLICLASVLSHPYRATICTNLFGHSICFSDISLTICEVCWNKIVNYSFV